MTSRRVSAEQELYEQLVRTNGCSATALPPRYCSCPYCREEDPRGPSGGDAYLQWKDVERKRRVAMAELLLRDDLQDDWEEDDFGLTPSLMHGRRFRSRKQYPRKQYPTVPSFFPWLNSTVLRELSAEDGRDYTRLVANDVEVSKSLHGLFQRTQRPREDSQQAVMTVLRSVADKSNQCRVEEAVLQRLTAAILLSAHVEFQSHAKARGYDSLYYQSCTRTTSQQSVSATTTTTTTTTTWQPNRSLGGNDPPTKKVKASISDDDLLPPPVPRYEQVMYGHTVVE